MFFAFTVFSAYTEFAQYFVVWNANMPEETFWYLIRENGSWWCVEHDFDFRQIFPAVLCPAAGEGEDQFQNHHSRLPLGVADAAADLAFNILPALHPRRLSVKWIWLPLGCLMFMGGFLGWSFRQKVQSPSAVSAARPAPARSDGRESSRRRGNLRRGFNPEELHES